MFTNIVVGMIIPWLICFYLFVRTPKLVILMFPLGISIAFFANDWGFDIFWEVMPDHENPSLSSIPYNIGYFPLLTISYSYFHIVYKTNHTPLVVFFTIVTTLIEWVGVLSGKVHYFGGWLIFYTSFTYLAGFLICVGYIKLLYRYKIL